VILVDTSVLIRHFRNPTAARARLLRTVDPVVCGLVVAEFLAGARTPAQVRDCDSLLLLFGRTPTPETAWEPAGRYQAALLAKGRQFSLIDVIVAAIAVELGVELWVYDAHFAAIAAAMPGLRLYNEPTPC